MPLEASVEAARTFLSWIGRLGVGGPGAPPCAFPIRCSGLGEANPRRAPAASKTDHKKAAAAVAATEPASIQLS